MAFVLIGPRKIHHNVLILQICGRIAAAIWTLVQAVAAGITARTGTAVFTQIVFIEQFRLHIR